MDMEDFFVSNICLPVGSFIITLFCTWKLGWGFDRFIEEANEGQGLSVARKFQWYFKYILPCIVGVLVVYGIVTYFRLAYFPALFMKKGAVFFCPDANPGEKLTNHLTRV